MAIFPNRAALYPDDSSPKGDMTRSIRVGAMGKCRTGALAALLWLIATAAGAEVPGVSAERILFGQSAALGGPTADLGNEMRRGILAAFEEVNRSGGVN